MEVRKLARRSEGAGLCCTRTMFPGVQERSERSGRSERSARAERCSEQNCDFGFSVIRPRAMPIRIVPRYYARGYGRFEKLLYGCRNHRARTKPMFWLRWTLYVGHRALDIVRWTSRWTGNPDGLEIQMGSSGRPIRKQQWENSIRQAGCSHPAIRSIWNIGFPTAQLFTVKTCSQDRRTRSEVTS